MATDDESRDWDVVVANGNLLELVKVKSGGVDKNDQPIFWARLRRELGINVSGMSEIHPRLVVDPDKTVIWSVGMSWQRRLGSFGNRSPSERRPDT